MSETSGTAGGPPGDELNGPEEQTAPEVSGAPPPAVAAPTATRTPVPPRTVRGRRRRRGLALLLLVVVPAAVAGVFFLSGDYQQERAFEREVEKLMTALSDGKAEDVYEHASPRFQQTLLVDKFLDLVERMNATLGKFVDATDIIDVDRAVGVAGMTAVVLVELEFEHGTTRARLSFHRSQDGVWRLLGFSIEIPPELEGKAAALEAQEERLRAPDEVIKLVHSILQGVREGRAVEVHEGASPAFKGTVTIDGFKTMLQSHQAELGNFVRVLAIMSSTQSSDRDRAGVQSLLEYEKGKTTGSFEFIRISGAWRLARFKVVITSGEANPTEKPL